MVKKIIKKLKLQIVAGKATPAPPVGPALGQAGINIMKFIKEFNDKSLDKKGLIVPVIITVFEDHSFTFIIKISPVSVLLKEMAKIEKGSKDQKNKIATLTIKQIEEIAKKKILDLNAFNINSAIKIIKGTAKSMGINIIN